MKISELKGEQSQYEELKAKCLDKVLIYAELLADSSQLSGEQKGLFLNHKLDKSRAEIAVFIQESETPLEELREYQIHFERKIKALLKRDTHLPEEQIPVSERDLTEEDPATESEEQSRSFSMG